MNMVIAERIYNKLGLNFCLRYAWLQKCDGNDKYYNELNSYDEK